jgi:NAD(P)-dependent dehydrogenase (short-subunit alcohol dehydrogenase family)
VAPGTVDTEIHAAGGDPDRPARVAARIPLGRRSDPEEMARAVVWLAMDAPDYMTAERLNVSGGLDKD